MSQSSLLAAVKVESIFHPSDFSEASEIALVAKGKLTVLHVNASPNVEWQDFPGVRETLERWKLIPKDSPRSAVRQLGIDVEKSSRRARVQRRPAWPFWKRMPAT